MAKDAIQVVVEFLSKGVEGILQSLNKVQNAMTSFAFMGGKFDDKTQKMTKGLTTFRMEMLSVMFFGMMLQKTFMGMLSPTLELMGVFDLLGITLQMVLLPVLLPLLPIFIELSDKIMSLPDPIKSVIGSFIILGAILGTFLFSLAMLDLGWAGLVTAFGKVQMIQGIVTGGLGGISVGLGTLLVPILLLAAVLVLLWLAWETNFGNIRGFVEKVVGVIGKIFDGLVETVQGAIDFIGGILTLDAERTFKGFQTMVDGVGKIVTAILIDLGDAVAEFALNLATDLLESLINIPGKLYDYGRDMMLGLARGISSVGNVVAEAFYNVLPEPLQNMARNSIPQAVGIAGSLMNTILKTAMGGKNIFGFEQGGIMPYTGLAYLHKGETITPAGETNYYPTSITISNPVISSSYDVRNLARELNEYWESGRRTSR